MPLTPIVCLWVGDTAHMIAPAVDARMREAGCDEALFRSLDARGDWEPRIIRLYTDLITLTAADPTLHVVAVLSLTDFDAAEAIRHAAEVIAGSGLSFSLEIIGLDATLAPLMRGEWDSDELRPTPTETDTQQRTLTALSQIAAQADFGCTVTTIGNFTEKGTAVRFEPRTLQRFFARLLKAYVEDYRGMHPSGAVPDRNTIAGIGMAELRFEREAVCDYLLHRSFVAALDRAGINLAKIDTQATVQRANAILEGIESFYDRFFAEEVQPLLDRHVPEADIAAQLAGPLQQRADALVARLTGFFHDSDLSLPEKEATWAMLLGCDNPRLDGVRYSEENRFADDALSVPLDIYIKSFNECLDGGSELPVRGSYPELRYPDVAPGIEDVRNSMAFNPIAELKRLKSRIMDQTSYIRDKEDELARLRRSMANRQMTDVTVTDGGTEVKGSDARTIEPIVEQPLNDKYTPPADLHPAESVDLRPRFSAIRDQGQLGACTTFAVTSIYESILNHLNPGTVNDLSERFVFYHTNVLQGRPRGGASYSTVIGALGKHGICSEKICPYTLDTIGVKPDSDAETEAAAHRVLKALQIPLSEEGSLYDRMQTNHRLLTSALSEGYPVGIGLKLFDGFSRAGANIPRPTDEQIAAMDDSSHAMVLVGYSEKDGCYIVRNSWGTGFGDKGYCYISRAYIDDPALNLYACIITETTDGAARADAPPLVASFPGTETQCRINAITNALDMARVLYTQLESEYTALYSYYRDLIAAVEQPAIRKTITAAAEQQANSQVAAAQALYNDAINQFAQRIRDFRHGYIKVAASVTGAAVVLDSLAAAISYNWPGTALNTWLWIIAGLATLSAIVLWINYSVAVRRERRRLREEAATLNSSVADRIDRLKMIRIRHHVAEMVLTVLGKKIIALGDDYTRLCGYNNNLRCWHDEYSLASVLTVPKREAMFIGMADATVLDRFFDANVDRIIAGIDLVGAFDKFNLTPQSMQGVRDDLERSTRRAISAMFDGFRMYDYLSGMRSYDFLPESDIAAVMRDMINMSVVLARTRILGETSAPARYMAVEIREAERPGWDTLMQPFYNPVPAVVTTSDPDSFMLVTTRILRSDELVI